MSAFHGRFLHVSHTMIVGVASCADRSRRIFDLVMLVDGVEYLRFRKKRLLGVPRFFRFPARFDCLEPGVHTISLLFPDGARVDKTFVTPLRVETMTRRRLADLRSLAAPIGSERLESLSVIVPVHNSVDDVRKCVDNLFSHTSESVEILFIDDASTDPGVRDVLRDAQARRAKVRVLVNPANLGFTQTVNRGLAETGRNDVVLLNSDARVTPRWLEGLLTAAQSDARVGSVTPMSDRAGLFSAPEIDENAISEIVDESAYARAFRRQGCGTYPQTPTGNGFCLFLRRACLDVTGAFDAEAFPVGYGEENDLGMRSRRAGWRNVVDDCTYVFHEGSKSFGDGERRNACLASARAVLRRRYPDYWKRIRVFTQSPDFHLARYQARRALEDAKRAPFIFRTLFVSAALEGGTPLSIADLAAGLAGDIEAFLLRCDSRSLFLDKLDETGKPKTIRRHDLKTPLEPSSHRSDEYDAVFRAWVNGVDPDLVHIHHLGWNSLTAPRIAQDMGVKVAFTFHDFYAVCPNTKLLDGAMRNCEGRCASNATDCEMELWSKDVSPPRLESGFTNAWRRNFEDALRYVDVFFAPSESAKKTVLDNFPTLRETPFHVIPHGRDFPRFRDPAQPPKAGEPLRVLILGNISVPKGIEIVNALARRDGELRRLEFHILGKVSKKHMISSPNVIYHGAYDRNAVFERTESFGVHIGAIFSLWRETHCYTLEEMFAIGLPVVVFDFPAPSVRVRESGCGWVFPPPNDIDALYQRLLDLRDDLEDWAQKCEALREWRAGAGRTVSIRAMALRYRDVYRSFLGDGSEAD